MIKLIYPKVDADAAFFKFHEDPGDRSKVIWLFPDINATFGSIHENDGNIVIEPSMYYITSGEAVRKTEVLVEDIKVCISNHSDDSVILERLTDMLLDVCEFLKILKSIKASSKYLEITKCEDGIFDGNICSRKDPRKRKSE